MSFGFGVGDFIAVLELFERIAREIRHYRGAPQHFQELQAELGLMKSTLSHVLQLQPQAESPEETASIEQIRAIALHCQRPLLDFVEKLRRREPCLGHFKTTSTLATVGARLHWTLISRADVDDLRRVLLSQMLALNVLLGTHQLKCLHLLKPVVTSIAERPDGSNEIKAISEKIDVLGELSKRAPSAIMDLRNLIVGQNTVSTTQIATIGRNCDEIRDNVTSLSLSVTAGKRSNKRLSRALIRLFSVIEDIRALLFSLLQYSRDALETIQKNASMLMSIQATMRRIAEGIESIPLHLSLPIIRLDDALGESWALPFQACTNYTAFQNVLQAVVFPNSRPGSNLARSDMYALTFARSITTIHKDQWSQTVKPGAHIQQAMITADDGRCETELCSFRGCYGQMSDSIVGDDKTERTCGRCGRSSIIELDDSIFVAQDRSKPGSSSTRFPNSGRPRPNYAINSSMPVKDATQALPRIEVDESARFRRTITYKFRAMQTLEEALEAISKDKLDARANQFMGWWFLTQDDDTEGAIDHFEIAIKSGIQDTGQTFYLLGRAFMKYRDDRYPRAAENPHFTDQAFGNYKKAVETRRLVSSYWLSIAVLYYVVKQYRDSLDSLSRAARLNPMAWEVWYNLGVLVSSDIHGDDYVEAL
ncbi:hypothetical protein KVR01_007429 [Diaporthe batatas]|uniref:uncharacterized protein n=1 Tax=Diaporthe batatas TaxID=748121 RepID=UPI001D03AC69|nr:uncharacterized protein KVR01_007429 [Diaporthe batatas]KAG8162951.1 hypothetical protein KVR01_007429 [Diaporthe batatas]